MSVSRLINTFYSAREALEESRSAIIIEAANFVAEFIKQQALVKLQLGDGSVASNSILITVDVPRKLGSYPGSFDPAALLDDTAMKEVAKTSASKLRVHTASDASIEDVTVALYEPRGFSSQVPPYCVRYTVTFTRLIPF